MYRFLPTIDGIMTLKYSTYKSYFRNDVILIMNTLTSYHMLDHSLSHEAHSSKGITDYPQRNERRCVREKIAQKSKPLLPKCDS